MKNVGTKFFEFIADERDVALEKRVVFQAFIHFNRDGRAFQGNEGYAFVLSDLGFFARVDAQKRKFAPSDKSDQTIACHRNAVDFEK